MTAMYGFPLWKQLEEWKSQKYQWLDLSHELCFGTPHWHGFSPLSESNLFDFDQAQMKVFEYTVAGQYGTHVDVPGHFDPQGRLMHEIEVQEFVYPLCVIDKSEAVKENPDYALTKEDVLRWESVHGIIPENAFVAFRSDWSKRPPSDYDNKDEDGNAHYPGWDLDCVKWLCDIRKIGAIGHETPDTDPAVRQKQIGFAAEDYVLRKDKLNVEVLNNLDQLPAVGSIIFCVFPRLKNGTGFPSRCFALAPTA